MSKASLAGVAVAVILSWMLLECFVGFATPDNKQPRDGSHSKHPTSLARR